VTPPPTLLPHGPQTALAREHLSFSGRTLGAEPELLRALLQVKKAAALANAAAGALAPERSRAIVGACDALLADPSPASFPVDLLSGGGGIAFNVNLNEAIAARAGGAGLPIDAKAHVNASQSSADVCHTAFRLAVLARWDDLAPALDALHASLEERAKALASVTTLTRTCLRDALPGALGDLLGGHAALIARRRAALAQATAPLHAVNLGGTVIGSGEGAPAGYRTRVVEILAQLSGRALRRRENLFDAAQNSDDLAAVSSALAQLATALLKLAQDLRLLSSGPETGFGELVLPAVMEGSSFFRGKWNPVVPESLMHCCFQVLGCDHAVQAACARAELQLNVLETVAAVGVLDAMTMLAAAVGRFEASCVRGLTADEARCREHAARAHPR
jgi:aspartate ammonia-lyase